MKIYISGKITGLPLEIARQKFEDAENMLDDMNSFSEVVNPFKNGLPASASWKEHMERDIELLLGCDAIYMMEGWQDSTGARIEFDIANRVGMALWFAKHDNEDYNLVMARIQSAIRRVMGLEPWQYIKNDNRKRHKVFARMIFAHHCRLSKINLVCIASCMGRDHTSVLHLLKRYEDEFRYNAEFREIAKAVDDLFGKQRQKGEARTAESSPNKGKGGRC